MSSDEGIKQIFKYSGNFENWLRDFLYSTTPKCKEFEISNTKKRIFSCQHLNLVIKQFKANNDSIYKLLYKKMKFSIKNFFSKCDQIRRILIWSHLSKKFLIKNLICQLINLECLKLRINWLWGREGEVITELKYI